MLLEDFADPFADRRARVRQPKAVQEAMDAAEAERTKRYEEGYRQGWEDAAARIKSDDARTGARAAARIEGLAHTQRAAMALCLAQLEPVLAEVFDKVLPRAADRGFVGLIVQEAGAMLRSAENHVLALHVAPDAVEPVKAALAAAEADLSAVRLQADPELEPMQALLSHPGAEREVDVDRILDALDQSFDAMRRDLRSAAHE